jgi:hypothetical protein
VSSPSCNSATMCRGRPSHTANTATATAKPAATSASTSRSLPLADDTVAVTVPGELVAVVPVGAENPIQLNRQVFRWNACMRSLLMRDPGPFRITL